LISESVLEPAKNATEEDERNKVVGRFLKGVDVEGEGGREKEAERESFEGATGQGPTPARS